MNRLVYLFNILGTVHLTGYQLDGDNGLSDFGDFDEEEEESDTEGTNTKN